MIPISTRSKQKKKKQGTDHKTVLYITSSFSNTLYSYANLQMCYYMQEWPRRMVLIFRNASVFIAYSMSLYSRYIPDLSALCLVGYILFLDLFVVGKLGHWVCRACKRAPQRLGTQGHPTRVCEWCN